MSVAKGRGHQFRDLHDAIGMVTRELLFDGRAFGKGAEYKFFHGGDSRQPSVTSQT